MTIEPGQTWELGELRPADAPGVCELVRLAFGEHYPVATFREPAQLVAASASDAIRSVVARTLRGEVVGHLACYQATPNPHIWEVGVAAVHPAYQGNGIFQRMGEDCLARIRRDPASQVAFAENMNLVPQCMAHAVGMVSMALAVDQMPAAAPARASCILDFVLLHPHPHAIHLPAAHADNLRFLCDGLGDARQMLPAEGSPPREGGTAIQSQVFPEAQVGRFVISRLGADLAEAFAREEASALAQGVKVCQAWLPLAAPAVGWAADLLAGRGYFLGGLLPCWFGEDGLLLQRTLAPPHFAEIKLRYPRSREILARVREDWRRVAG